jgi:phosphotransferase system  glucose/maltose/N-acetylglucosamine-specific IIC component
MQKALIVAGVVLVLAGLLWPLLSRFGLFRLPGDLAFGGEGFRVYIPLMTSLVISAVLTLILWLINR